VGGKHEEEDASVRCGRAARKHCCRLSVPAVAVAAWDGRKLPFGEVVKVSTIHTVRDKFSRNTLLSEPYEALGWEDYELLLVYECMAKGSLENHLFSVHAKKSVAALQFVAWPLVRFSCAAI
jgi:hypothetical protein